MTPIDETDLRHDLREVEPLSGDFPTEAIIARGRHLRRRRRVAGVLGGAAAVTVLALGVGQLLPLMQSGTPGVPMGAPSQSNQTRPPSPTYPPSPSPKSIPGGDSPIPKALGTVDIRLPHEGVKAPAGSDESDWTPSDWFYKACFSQPDAFAPATLRGSKVIQLRGPQTVETEGALVFATERDAVAFLRAMGPGRQGCDKELSSETSRVRVDHVTPVADLKDYDESLAASDWGEEKVSGTWHQAPDGGVYALARQANVVVFAQIGGEFVGNSLKPKDPWAVHQLTGRLVGLLPQVCRVTGAC